SSHHSTRLLPDTPESPPSTAPLQECPCDRLPDGPWRFRLAERRPSHRPASQAIEFRLKAASRNICAEHSRACAVCECRRRGGKVCREPFSVHQCRIAQFSNPADLHHGNRVERI